MSKQIELLQGLIQQTKAKELKWYVVSKVISNKLVKYNERTAPKEYLLESGFYTPFQNFIIVTTKETYTLTNRTVYVAYILDNNFEIQIEYNRTVLNDETILERLYRMVSRDGYLENDILEEISKELFNK